MLHIFDTDHISLLHRRNANVIARLERLSLDERAVTIITVIEQIQGRLAVIRHATSEADVVRGCERLQETMRFYASIYVLPYDVEAQLQFAHLRTSASPYWHPRSTYRGDCFKQERYARYTQ
jgi:tRNA(fMet)-specific endonuclease VapC